MRGEVLGKLVSGRVKGRAPNTAKRTRRYVLCGIGSSTGSDKFSDSASSLSTEGSKLVLRAWVGMRIIGDDDYKAPNGLNR